MAREYMTIHNILLMWKKYSYERMYVYIALYLDSNTKNKIVSSYSNIFIIYFRNHFSLNATRKY